MPDRVIGSIDLKVGFGEEIDQCGLKSYIIEYLNAYNIPYSTDYSIGQMITLLADKINKVNPYADCGIVSEPQRFFGNYEEAVIVRDVEGSCTIPGAINVVEQKVIFTAGDIVINGDDNHYWMAMVDKPESEPTNAGHLAGEWCDITDMCAKFDLLFPFTIEYNSEGVPVLIEGDSIIKRVEDLENYKDPDIRLNGDKTLFIEFEDDYSELGAKVYVNNVYDSSIDVEITGEVDSSVSGSYLITYKSVIDGIIIETNRIINVLPECKIIVDSSPDTIPINSSISDFSAVDCEGNDVTSSVVVDDSNVDYDTPGTYTVYYKFEEDIIYQKEVIIIDCPITITINGDNPSSVNVNGTYTDAGATAVDCEGNDVTSSTVTNNGVDTSTEGSYTVTYSLNDVTETRTVNVVNCPITITINGDNPSSVNINSTYTDAGATAVDCDGNDVTSSIVTNNGVDTSTEGSYTVTYSLNGVTATRTVNVVNNCIITITNPNNDGLSYQIFDDYDNPYCGPITNVDLLATAVDCDGNNVPLRMEFVNTNSNENFVDYVTNDNLTPSSSYPLVGCAGTGNIIVFIAVNSQGQEFRSHYSVNTSGSTAIGEFTDWPTKLYLKLDDGSGVYQIGLCGEGGLDGRTLNVTDLTKTLVFHNANPFDWTITIDSTGDEIVIPANSFNFDSNVLPPSASFTITDGGAPYGYC